MRAIGYTTQGPIAGLEDFDAPEPVAGGRDLLVAVKAISVNPIDTKVRVRAAPAAGNHKILGYDAAGTVVACGPDVTLFQPGDDVFYAGSIGRQGTNAELHCVDERITGHKPKTLGFAEAAALPLTAITAWEALFDRLTIRTPLRGVAPAVLIIGGAGGVGSIAIQLARHLTNLTVIATASRPQTQEWCRDLGAHHVIDHTGSLADAYAALNIPAPPFVFSITGTDTHITDIAKLIAPQGRVAVIDDPEVFDVKVLKGKAISLHWESMFTRSTFATPDMIAQHELLEDVSRLVDAGTLRTTLGEHFGTINAANIRRAHEKIESGTAKGKIVLEGF